MTITANPVTFNGISLNSISGLTVLKIDPYRIPKRTLSTYSIARTHKSKTNSAFYTDKNILVKVGISRATRNLLEVSLESLINILHDLEADLIVPQGNALRRYTCTLADTVFAQDGGSYVEIDLIFACSDRFGYDIAQTLLKQVTGFTSGQSTNSFTVEGSAPTQAPKITLTYSALTGGTSKEVVIGNGSTGQAITISRTWASGDVIVIDCLNRTVKVNGTDVSFTGAFPDFATGIGYLTYADQFTARTFNMTVNYYKRYA